MIITLLVIIMLCMLLTNAKSDDAKHEKATVTGTAFYLQRIALPPDTMMVQVQLVDISKQDVEALVLGEQTITPMRQVPISFEISYNPEDIIPNHRYAIQARITEIDGPLWFITTQAFLVITDGHPSSDVQVILQMVR